VAKRKSKGPSSCRKKFPTGDRCDGKFVLRPGEYPVFVCDTCGEINNTWEKFLKEYLELFKKRESWDDPKHKTSCVLGLFTYRYKEFYGVDYAWVPKSPNPYSSKECKDANSLLATFSGNAHTVRKYINWFFAKKIRGNTKIVSMAYLTTPNIIREYVLYRRNKNRVARSNELSGDFLNMCEKIAPSIFRNYELKTVNDLGAILNTYKFYKMDEESDEHKVIAEAQRCGLIENGQLKIS
jgi:hypothetical protein